MALYSNKNGTLLEYAGRKSGTYVCVCVCVCVRVFLRVCVFVCVFRPALPENTSNTISRSIVLAHTYIHTTRTQKKKKQ